MFTFKPITNNHNHKVLGKFALRKHLSIQNVFISFSCNIWLLLQKSRVIVERSYNCLCSYLVGPLGPLTLTTSLQGTIAIGDLISVYKTMIVWYTPCQYLSLISFHFSHSTGFIWPQVMDTNRTQVPGEPSNRKLLLILYIYTICLPVEVWIQTFWEKFIMFLVLFVVIYFLCGFLQLQGLFWIFQEHSFECPNKISKVSGSMSVESDLQIWLSREPALMRHRDTK